MIVTNSWSRQEAVRWCPQSGGAAGAVSTTSQEATQWYAGSGNYPIPKVLKADAPSFSPSCPRTENDPAGEGREARELVTRSKGIPNKNVGQQYDQKKQGKQGGIESAPGTTGYVPRNILVSRTDWKLEARVVLRPVHGLRL